MKRLIGLILTVMLMMVLVACGGSTDQDNTAEKKPKDEIVEISYYLTGALNVKELWEEIIPEFEKEHPNIKVKLVHMDASGGPQIMIDRMQAARQAGKSSEIDVFSSDLKDVISGSKDELWVELSPEKIPNLANIEKDYLEGVDYMGAPYRASSVVLAYNSENILNPPKTADELNDWIRENPEKFAYNDPATGGAGNSFLISSVYNFLESEALLNSNPSTMEEWNQGFDLLKDLHPYMYQNGVYPKKNEGSMKLLSNGEVDIVPVWSDMALEHLDKKLLPESTKLVQIDPPLTGGPVYLLAVNDSEKKDAVYKFINFSLSPEVQTMVVNKMNGYPGIKWDEMPKEVRERFDGIEGNYRLTNLGDLEMELQRRWQNEVAGQ